MSGIEVGDQKFKVRATPIPKGPERDRLYEDHGKVYAAFRDWTRRHGYATSTPVWRPRIMIGMGSAAALSTQDFSPFRSLKLDVFNPEMRPINVQLEIADSRGYSFILPAVGLEGLKVTTVGADLPDLAAQDLDLRRIRHVAFHVDVTGRGSSPVLYLDYLRLESQ